MKNILTLISEYFNEIKLPEIAKRKPFSNAPINQPRGHSNSSCTKKVRMDSRVKKPKCRLSHMQRRAAFRRSH